MRPLGEADVRGRLSGIEERPSVRVRRRKPWRQSALVAALMVLAAGEAAAQALLQTPAPRGRAVAPVATCDVEGWSNESGEEGLPVRNAPAGDGLAISRLPPPIARGLDEFAVTVRIIGWRPGWFQIGEAAYPPNAYGPGTPRRPVFMGTGWVPTAAIKVQLAGDALRLTPEPGSRILAPLVGERGSGDARFAYGPADVAVSRVLACRGRWVEVETEFGRGWVARACGEQLAPCP